ncbi:translationally-controlled tumor protein homolog [Anneissia japonica]|uniref:translationally-controlled tumor protein homolog n=1 Tax=Anneissia japonica TaxID=1529436 RepID=UPI0014254B25|nr:translationally-controlled tumor protein homolog [Anneissia japonica]
MIIYKDRFTGDEMFSDVLEFQKLPEDSVLFEFNTKKVSDKTDMSQVNIGANASAEEAAEEVEDVVTKDFEIVINHGVKLEESKPAKGEFKAYMKRHLKKLYEELVKEVGQEKADIFKKNATSAAQQIIKGYGDYDLYTGETADFNNEEEHCAVLLLNYRDDGTTPYFTGFKADFVEEKV